MITEQQIATFLSAAQAKCDTEHATGTMHSYTQLSTERGRRYVRIVAEQGGQRCAWGFVDLTNGDVLKADSWKAPAKGARGNICDAAGGIGRARWTGVA